LKQLARFSALSYKAQENAIVMVEPFAMDAPKTKEFIQILENIKANGRRTLFVLPQGSENIYKSSRNLQNVNVITIDEINTYNIMNAYQLVLVDGVQDIIAARRK
jgi:large subunit ribosomal protein L4